MNQKLFYEPAEDSKFLLLKIKEFIIKNFLKKKKIKEKEKIKICEIGVGSGFILLNLIKKLIIENKLEYFQFFGTDINKYAIKDTKKEIKKVIKKFKSKKLVILKNGNLFDKIKEEKFDLIYFNTPYLPCERNEKYNNLNNFDKAIYGGKQGYEVIEKFIKNLNLNLNDNGNAIILYSSLSKPKEIEKILNNHLFEFEIIEKENYFFEELIIIKIFKSLILKDINRLNIKKLKFLSKGKHSIVFEGKYKNKEVIIKIGKFEYIQKEAFFLKKLKEEKFVKNLLIEDKNFIVKEKSKGITIKEFIENSNTKKNDLIKVINNILNSTFRLDKMKINKFEMTNPYKHIFVQKDLNVEMIDFERCIFSKNPKNTTQFLQYIRRNKEIFKKKQINIDETKILKLSIKYHKNNNLKFKIEDLLLA